MLRKVGVEGLITHRKYYVRFVANFVKSKIRLFPLLSIRLNVTNRWH